MKDIKSNNENYFDIKGLSDGLYFVSFEYDGKRFLKKLVVKNIKE